MTEPAEKQKNYPLQQIYFYLTEGCNLQCRHCWIAPRYQGPGKTYPSLDLSLFRSILWQGISLGLTTVKLTGGEPLLHPDIYKILDEIKKQKLSLLVETNGVLCDLEISKKLKAADENTQVSVSIDGADAETHEWVRNVEGSFEDSISGVKNLVKAGFRPQLIMSIMRKNLNQLEDIIKLAESLGAASVKFNLVQPTARGETLHEAGETLTIEELVETGRKVENVLSKTTSLKLIYHQPPAFRSLGRMFGEKESIGCSVCGIFTVLGVLSDGSYAFCGIGETIPEFIFGHAEKDSLRDVWNNTPMLNKIREGLPSKLEGICGNCILKGTCLGSCVAQNYYRSRELFAPFWFCDQAKQKGLFPSTRLKE